MRTATSMAFRQLFRRPLVPIMLVIVPALVIAWSVAITEPDVQRVKLASGVWVTTTMKDLHGPEMAEFTVAVVSALLGVFVMRSALLGDRRLVMAGLRAREAILARLLVLLGAAAVVVGVAAVVMGLQFVPASWAAALSALAVTALIYTALGALIGVLLDKVAATYVILFVVTADLSVVQTPMFHPEPGPFAPLLPAFGPTQMLLEASYAQQLQIGSAAFLSLAWIAVLGTSACLALRRIVGRTHTPEGYILQP